MANDACQSERLCLLSSHGVAAALAVPACVCVTTVCHNALWPVSVSVRLSVTVPGFTCGATVLKVGVQFF